jgi:hypothetical protein
MFRPINVLKFWFSSGAKGQKSFLDIIFILRKELFHCRWIVLPRSDDLKKKYAKEIAFFMMIRGNS